MLIGAELAIVQARVRGLPSDFFHLWRAAQLLLAGENPYALIGPGRAVDFQFPVFYPLTSIVVSIPFSVLPIRWADTLFVTLSAGLLAWALTAPGRPRAQLAVFGSFAFLLNAELAQWSAFITAAALLPPWGGLLLACKPTTAAALWLAFPSGRSLLVGVAFAGLTVAVWPWWVAEWWATTRTATHLVAPLMTPAGPLVLLALARWRTPEARLLVALACVPHTPVLYEAIPLFLCVRYWWEGIVLCVSSVVVWLVVTAGLPYGSVEEYTYVRATWQVVFLYLPCVWFIWRRPTTVCTATVPPTMSVIAWLRARLDDTKVVRGAQ
jgi:hypothetical protein